MRIVKIKNNMRTLSFCLSSFILLSLASFVALAQSQSPCSGSASIIDTTQAQPGVLAVVSNSDQATFTVTGPATYHGSGYYWVQQGVPAGTYTITWGTVAGCGTPQTETKSTDAAGSVAFSGNYKDLNPSSGYGTIIVRTNLNTPTTITISGPATKVAKGTGFTWALAPPGTYTVSCEGVEGYNTPQPDTETLAPGGSGYFHCDYTVKKTTTSDMQQFTILSEPISGANVYIDGILVGKTPVRATAYFGSRNTVKCSLDGYEDFIGEYRAPDPGTGVIVVNPETHCFLTPKNQPPLSKTAAPSTVAPQEQTKGVAQPSGAPVPASPPLGFFARIWKILLSIFGIR